MGAKAGVYVGCHVSIFLSGYVSFYIGAVIGITVGSVISLVTSLIFSLPVSAFIQDLMIRHGDIESKSHNSLDHTGSKPTDDEVLVFLWALTLILSSSLGAITGPTLSPAKDIRVGIVGVISAHVK